MTAVVIVLVVSSLIGLYLGWKQSFPPVFYKSFILWIFGALALTSFFALSWVTFTDQETLASNADTAAKQISSWQKMDDFPILENIIPEEQFVTQSDVLALFDEYPYSGYIELIDTNEKMTGWHLMRLSRYKQPGFSLLLGFAVFVIFLSTLAVFIQMLPIGNVSPSVQGFLSLVVIIPIINFLINIPTFDSLGVSDDFRMRLLAVLAEARVSETYLLFLFSLVFIAVSGFEHILLLVAPRKFMEYPDEDQSFEF